MYKNMAKGNVGRGSRVGKHTNMMKLDAAML
jgi:hypothetical protein